MQINLLILRHLRKEYIQRIPSKYNIRMKDINDATIDDYKWAEVIVGKPDIELLKECENLKFVQLEMAGNDKYIDLSENVRLCNASGSFGWAIGEYVIGGLLMLMRNFHLYYEHQKNHVWKVEPFISAIEGSIVLIVGCGDVGSSIAKRIKALNGKTIGIKRKIENVPYFDEIYDQKSLKKCIRRADVVIFALPKTNESNQMMNQKCLRAMKFNSIFVNVGRGNVVDIDELYNLLCSGKIKGAILDVFEKEPLDENHPIWNLSNVIITPHISGTFQLEASFDRFMSIMIHNLKAYINEEEWMNVVNRTKQY